MRSKWRLAHKLIQANTGRHKRSHGDGRSAKRARDAVVAELLLKTEVCCCDIMFNQWQMCTGLQTETRLPL